jgi:hypothetical protein
MLCESANIAAAPSPVAAHVPGITYEMTDSWGAPGGAGQSVHPDKQYSV